MQGKYYWLHWGVMAGPFTVITLTLADEALESFGAFVSAGRSVARAALASAVVLFLFISTPNRSRWVDAHTNAYELLTHKITREEFARRFNIGVFGYVYADIDLTAQFLAEHSRPEDEICVRGFNPEVYILAHRRYSGRFFWTPFLVEPGRAYRREAYLAEDREAFDRLRPRFVVTVITAHEGIESTAYYLPLGYKIVATFGGLQVLERGA